MRAKEFLTEKISLSKHYDALMSTIAPIINKDITEAAKFKLITKKLMQAAAAVTGNYIQVRFRELPNHDGQTIDNWILLDTGLLNNPHDLISTFLHELVHILQNLKQSHRPETEYRSYMDSQKIKRKTGKSEMGSFENVPDKLYYSSPQEIAAFAHNAALDIVKMNPPRTLQQYIPDITKYIQNEFNVDQTVDKKYRKIFNRYSKLIYNEIEALTRDKS